MDRKQIKLICVFVVFIIFSFVKSYIEPDPISLDGGDYSKDYIIEDILKIKIIGFKDSYLKIIVEGNNNNPKVINHIISYYQDKDCKERKQLSQSLTNKTIMWLNTVQTKNDFYIKVECPQVPCSFILSLKKTKEAELNLNEQYTYYVTEDNQNMRFKLLKSDIEETRFDPPFIRVWGRGNKKVEVESEESIFEEYYSHFCFDIDSNNFKEKEYYWNIKGEVGDLINIGIILFNFVRHYHHGSDYILENGEEVTSFHKNGEREIYQIKTGSPNNLGYFYDFNNILLNADVDYAGHIGIGGKIDLFYTLQYINNTEYDGQGNNKYSPLLDGIYTIKKIEENTTIGLIPMKPKDNFNFLTYEVFPIGGDINVSIYECDNYPLCHLNEIRDDKLKKLEYFQSYYYTFKNDEWDSDISPISKNQKMLLITCKKGLILAKNDQRYICTLSINMKTDNRLINNTDFHLALPPYQRFIRKDNVDKYFLKGTNNPIHLHIEKITGDIEIEIKPDIIGIEYKKIIDIPRNIDTRITIKALNNSIYSIKDNYYNNNKNFVLIGYNYLFKLDYDNENMILYPRSRYRSLEIYNYYETYDDYFIKIYPLNCDIKMEQYYDFFLEKSFNLTINNYYQDSFSTSKIISFKISAITNKYNCLFYLDTFEKNKSIHSSYNTGITVGNNSPQSFTFNNAINQIILLYPYIEFENDVKIYFEQLDKKSYQYLVDINVSDKNIKEKEKLTKKTTIIQLKAEEIKNNCNTEFICKIIVKIESENEKIESNLKITFNKEGNTEIDDKDQDDDKDDDKDNDKDDDDDDKILIIIFSILGVVIIVVIAFGLYYYFKVYANKKNLNDAVNQISFKDNDKNNDDDEIGNRLID